MPIKTDKMNGGLDFKESLRLEHPVDLAHYLRQATITRRRHSSILNFVWCKHRQLAGNFDLWKH